MPDRVVAQQSQEVRLAECLKIGWCRWLFAGALLNGRNAGRGVPRTYATKTSSPFKKPIWLKASQPRARKEGAVVSPLSCRNRAHSLLFYRLWLSLEPRSRVHHLKVASHETTKKEESQCRPFSSWRGFVSRPCSNPVLLGEITSA